MEAESDASRERFSFSKTKIKVIAVSHKKRGHKPTDPGIILNNVTLQTYSFETHLGISRHVHVCDARLLHRLEAIVLLSKGKEMEVL